MNIPRNLEPNPVDEPRGFPLLVWIAAFLALATWVAHGLGAFSLWNSVGMPDGRIVRLADGFATVDHPFHVARAETLRRSLADGELLRWIGHHQGGYPVEFYPLGAAWLDVAGWALALGSLPMMSVHKLVIIAVFLLPMVGYAFFAGFDRITLGVALLATAAHVCVRGWWWSGGSTELVEWGLVGNVASATALLLALPLAVRFVGKASRPAGAGASMLCAFAIYANPRSGLALAALLAGVAAVVFLSETENPPRTKALRSTAIAALVALLTAPQVISLARFEELYYFVQYQRYSDLHAYWDSSIQAVGRPFFWLGIAGFVLAWLPGSHLTTRVIAATLAFYVAGTALVVEGVGPASLIDQLEATRLMPFQRLLWFFLAASAVHTVLLALLAAARAGRGVIVDGLLAAAAVVVVWLYVIDPPGFIPVRDRGMVVPISSAQAGIADLREAVELADQWAAPGTAVLVLGILGLPSSWHDQMWAPLWSERPFFYDDWLWYWQTKHAGEYDPLNEHAYRSDASALDRTYLDRHGMGAVIVTGEAKPAAGGFTYLDQVRAGIWDVYVVVEPTTIVTFSGANTTSSSIDNQRISATGTAEGGEIVVRRNWFPRWHATIDGEPAEVRELDDGYMSIAAPSSGEATVTFTYRLDWIDWLARAAAAAGLIGVAGLLLPSRFLLRPRVRSARR